MMCVSNNVISHKYNKQGRNRILLLLHLSTQANGYELYILSLGIIKQPPPNPPRLTQVPPVHLCGPDSLDSVRHTNIRRLKLVQSQADHNSRRVQAPGKDLARARSPLLRDVVCDDVLETGVRVDKDGGAKDGVHGRVERTGRKRCDGKRDQGRSNDAVHCPVVGAVRWGRGRYGCRVIY